MSTLEGLTEGWLVMGGADGVVGAGGSGIEAEAGGIPVTGACGNG